MTRQRHWRWRLLATGRLGYAAAGAITGLVLVGATAPGPPVVITEWKVPWADTRPRDPYLGVESLDGLERWVDNLRVQRFATAGHWVNQQEPARVNEALLEFLH